MRTDERQTTHLSGRSRVLTAYPDRRARRGHLALVIAITVALYYSLYVGGGVATLMLQDLHMSFKTLVVIALVGNLVGAFSSLGAGLADRWGRARIIVWGLFVVAVMTLFALPNAHSALVYGLECSVVAFVEGIILVSSPALVRDFSPQVGRATAMGLWTVGPVLGSLMVSLTTTLTLPLFKTWQSQFVICGLVCLVIFAAAFVFLRELSPRLRDQIIVSDRDRALIEARARGLAGGVDLEAPFRQLFHADILVSALGISLLLLFYYTSVSFGTVYLVTMMHFSVPAANMLYNFAWGLNAAALIGSGIASDRLKVRKPFMAVGAIGTLLFTVAWLWQVGGTPGFALLVVLACGQAAFAAMAYATWMASFTETVEARNPALTVMGLAIWGWIIRVTIFCAFVSIPLIIQSVTPLVGAPDVMAALDKARAAGGTPSPELLANVAAIKQAAAEAPGQWRLWYTICAAGVVVFFATIFAMRGRWSPAAARADEAAHDAAVAQALEAIRSAAPA